MSSGLSSPLQAFTKGTPRSKRASSTFRASRARAALRHAVGDQAAQRHAEVRGLECARWIRRRARFKSFGVEDGLGNNFLVVDKPEGSQAYLPSTGQAGFTTIELSVEADPGRSSPHGGRGLQLPRQL